MRYLILLTALTLTACVDMTQVREEYITTHKTPPKFAQAIRDGKIMVGMTKEDVEASWGGPCWYCYGTRETTWGDVWEYNVFGTGSYGIGAGTYVFFDTKDRVKGISR